MSNIKLFKMTKELARTYYQGFELDLDLFMNPETFQPYVYSEEKSDATVERYRQLGRVFLAIMRDDAPIGEVVLKNIDQTRKHCTLGISLQNDSVKGRGYGTRAEILALEYAFGEMGMETVFADSILKNTRSQHVLEKVGFVETGSDDAFRYYRCDKQNWKCPERRPLPETANAA